MPEKNDWRTREGEPFVLISLLINMFVNIDYADSNAPCISYDFIFYHLLMIVYFLD